MDLTSSTKPHPPECLLGQVGTLDSSPPGSTPSRMACLFEEASPRSTNVQFTSQQPGGAVPPGAVPVITSLPSNSSARTSMDVNSQNAPVFESAVIKEHPGPLPTRGETPERPAGFQQHPNNLSQSVCRTTPDAPSPPHGDLCPSEVVPTVKINWRPCKPQPTQYQTYHQQLSPVATVKNEVSSRPSCQQALTKNLACSKQWQYFCCNNQKGASGHFLWR